MTDFASLLQPDRGGPAASIHLVDKDSFADWAKRQSAARRALARRGPVRRQDRLPIRHPARRPGRRVGSRLDGRQCRRAVALVPRQAGRGAAARAATGWPKAIPGPATLGWLLGQHRFNAYKSKAEDERGPRILLTREAAEIERTVRLAEATALVRDLVDTPAADLGPAELEAAARDARQAIRRQGRGDRRRRARPGLSDDRRGRPGRHAASARRG